METNQFALHNGKIVFVPDVPEPDVENLSNSEAHAKYKLDLQSAIANGIEVENQKEVGDQIGAIGDIKENTLYPLQCRVEVIEEWIPGQGYNSPSKEIARVTFDEQPERTHSIRCASYTSEGLRKRGHIAGKCDCQPDEQNKTSLRLRT